MFACGGLPMSDHSTFTFVFTDIEGSSRLWEESPETMALALARHDTLLHDIFATHGGDVFKTMGDSLLVAFEDSGAALFAAVQAQRALLAEEWETARPLRVRAALHRGPAEQRERDYFGPTLNRTSRLLSAGHGGQTLLSRAAREDIALPDGISLYDLGERRLRDLMRPERIFQLVAPGLPTEFPPLRSLEVLPNNLPPQLTTFVGRERELEQAKELVQRSRLVTLTGPGGTGKTRLALEVAAAMLESFDDGVWLVELATVLDAARVGGTIAAALGAREDPERAIEDSLVDFLRSKELLLVLDNCEHLVAECALISARLLRGAPRLRILASSREPLAIPGETRLPVPSLSMPDFFDRKLNASNPAAVLEFEAVRLFAERATAVQPSFAVNPENAATVARICWRLDGIPLAIELAAARVKMLTLQQILDRLDDQFRLLTNGGRTALPRQQTLTALIDWSYALLNEKERTLLRRLAVFGRGRTLRAIEAVCAGDGIEQWEILDLLQQLIDKSLVSTELNDDSASARYVLLESVWDYANTKLAESGKASAVASRHLDFFLQIAEKAEPKLLGREQLEWIEKLAVEHGNLRLALDWAVRAPEGVERGLRLAGALERYWEVRTHLTEGRDYCAALLARPEATARTYARAKALAAAGRLAFCQDDDASARGLLTEAMELYRELGATREAMILEAVLGFVEWSDGLPAAARPHFEAVEAYARQHGETRMLAMALNGFGSLHADEGDYARARALKEESIAMYLETGDRWISGLQILSLVRVQIAHGDFAAAEVRLAEAAQYAEELGNELSIPYVLEGFGKIAAATGELEHATLLFGASQALRERLGFSSLPPAERPTYDQAMDQMRAGLTPQHFDEIWARGRALSTDAALTLAMPRGAIASPRAASETATRP
jgi:predicted ATPase/class 3 adenylate cyclase